MAITATIRRPAGFIIYKDEPQEVPLSKQTKVLASATRSATRIPLSSRSDKENLNPLTGRRPINEDNSLKARKTNALATKIIIATGKVLVDTGSPKKRKLVSQLECPTVKKERKVKRTTASRKAHRPSHARNTVELARLDEVAEEEGHKDVEERLHVRVTEAAANARCYELTVLPLADLSKAYEQFSSSEVITRRESSHDSELEDSPFVTVTRPPLSSDTEAEDVLSTPITPRPHVAVFNTPERKRIYSAFTFESPSPASRRFATWKESDMERFTKIAFNPLVRLAL
ncbi:hypothetical protein PHLGIDRAFT_113895 [Phlebiopsis gigantea 11061_1 CR5-6]|uniref:Uncharacterized protein n=1 Tax=Phlebiopsis gigantea (strain 11061_1 CR5-6) TaxID=745531 RepID=A0A0C3SFH7_PHLG1|nr:hypothetical protein PHLGIDRAFT_113895 [Phlebiopsis gigantea 11061_1 CR5-6]